MITHPHTYYMQLALAQAQLAYAAQEVPVGAVVVIDGVIIAKAHNQVQTLTDCTAHAEILALTCAFANLGSKYLPTATLYVTVEPCCMCTGAIYWSKLGQLVYGTPDEKHGGLAHVILHPKTQVIKHVLELECRQLMQQFFKERRIV